MSLQIYFKTRFKFVRPCILLESMYDGVRAGVAVGGLDPSPNPLPPIADSGNILLQSNGEETVSVAARVRVPP